MKKERKLFVPKGFEAIESWSFDIGKGEIYGYKGEIEAHFKIKASGNIVIYPQGGKIFDFDLSKYQQITRQIKTALEVKKCQ